MGGNRMANKNFLVGTLIGGIVGAAVALLFAPKPGRELREDITMNTYSMIDRASDLQEKGANWKDTVYEKGSALTNKAIDSTAELTRSVAQKTEDVKESIEQTLQKKRHVEDEAIEAAEAVSEKLEECGGQIEDEKEEHALKTKDICSTFDLSMLK